MAGANLSPPLYWIRIVIPGDKKMARWVRQVTALKIVAVQ